MKLKNNKLLFFISILLLSITSTSQVITDNKNVQSVEDLSLGKSESRLIFKRKSNLYFSWGYNRAFFSKSDIHFTGDGYDFTVKDVTARDQPGGHEFLTYIKPNMFTIPQFNARLGYFLNDKTFLSIGLDHMKYNLDKQATLLSGVISTGVNNGYYDNAEVLIGDDADPGVYQPLLVDSLPGGFVSEFEHCDGLNDLSLEFGRLEQLWISKNCKHAFSAIGTIGAGMMIPDTDADVLGQEPRHDMEAGKKAYHLAGYSFSASLGLQLDFYKHFFLLGKLNAGYINMPDINTTVSGGKASQHFYFVEPIVQIGYSHSIGKR